MDEISALVVVGEAGGVILLRDGMYRAFADDDGLLVCLGQLVGGEIQGFPT